MSTVNQLRVVVGLQAQHPLVAKADDIAGAGVIQRLVARREDPRLRPCQQVAVHAEHANHAALPELNFLASQRRTATHWLALTYPAYSSRSIGTRTGVAVLLMVGGSENTHNSCPQTLAVG